MPVRPALLALREQPYPALFGHGPITLLVVGGSQGAKVFSDLVPAALLLLPEHLQRRLRVFQQCRGDDLERVRALYHHHHIDCELRAFFDDMPLRLAEAHLVIGRSGASTVAELEAVGRPAILVPYPHAIDDHQTANASAFAGAGGGWLMPQSTLTPDVLAQFLETILSDPDSLNRAAGMAHAAAIPDAASRLADLVVDLAEGRA
jgi:UDP-N-acetylglucosamine--N-acetylmuramyl-(pentapeptide) pyrophosphoryl-undecaprenol N-acetylglucosamine transferase